jgi:hypothetical protein
MMFSYHDDFGLPCYGTDMQSEPPNPSDMPQDRGTLATEPAPDGHRRKRASRYVRAQERRDAQKRADQRFYNVIFGLVSLCVLVVLGLAALAMRGEFQGGTDSVDTPDVSRETFIGLSVTEWVGLVVVAVIGLFMWRRISRR